MKHVGDLIAIAFFIVATALMVREHISGRNVKKVKLELLGQEHHLSNCLIEMRSNMKTLKRDVFFGTLGVIIMSVEWVFSSSSNLIGLWSSIIITLYFVISTGVKYSAYRRQMKELAILEVMEV